MPFSRDLDLLRSISGSNPNAAMTMVDIARKATPGNPHPALTGKSPEELAILDRLAWGQQMKDNYGRIPALLSGAIYGGGYEAAKGLQQANFPGANKLMQFVGDLFGNETNAQQMEQDETTSPASLRNIGALLYGAFK